MKIGELKKVVAKLGEKVAQTSPELLDLVGRLESLLTGLNDNDEVSTQLREPLVLILDEFWTWVIKNLPYEKWQAGLEVEPWLELQRDLSKIPDMETLKPVEDLQNKLLVDELLLDKLRFQLEQSENEDLMQGRSKLAKHCTDSILSAQSEFEARLGKIKTLQQEIKRVEEGQKQKSREINKLIRRNFLAANYHHPRLFAVIEEKYKTLSSRAIDVNQLLVLLKQCGRVIKYAETTNLSDYPISSLPEKPLPQQQHRLKESVVLLASIYYLIFHYCSVEQLKLLPHLIYFRLETTDEERRSEQAIFNYLSTRILDSQLFFKKQRAFDSRAIKEFGLEQIKELPTSSPPALFYAVKEQRWIYAFVHHIRYRNSNLQATPENISLTLELLETDFASSGNQSYTAALNFAEGVIRQLFCLSEEEQKIVSSAIYLFCLDNYVREHQKLDERTSENSADDCQTENVEKRLILDFRQKFQFIAIPDNEWLLVFRQRSSALLNKDDTQLLRYAEQLFTIQFSTQEDKSYSAALKFFEEIERQYPQLSEKESMLVHDALHGFCLKQYALDRRSDKEEKHSKLSFSADTKCNGALKKRSSILGYAHQGMGFFERMALNQGRLKILEDTFESKKEARQTRF